MVREGRCWNLWQCKKYVRSEMFVCKFTVYKLIAFTYLHNILFNKSNSYIALHFTAQNCVTLLPWYFVGLKYLSRVLLHLKSAGAILMLGFVSFLPLSRPWVLAHVTESSNSKRWRRLTLGKEVSCGVYYKAWRTNIMAVLEMVLMMARQSCED